MLTKEIPIKIQEVHRSKKIGPEQKDLSARNNQITEQRAKEKYEKMQ